MSADEAPSDPDPTGGENPPVVEEEEKTSPTGDHKGSMLPPFIYDTSSVTERLMQRADAGGNEDSAGDGETSEETHPNNTEAKDSDHEESNPNILRQLSSQDPTLLLAPPFIPTSWTAPIESAWLLSWAPFKSSIDYELPNCVLQRPRQGRYHLHARSIRLRHIPSWESFDPARPGSNGSNGSSHDNCLATKDEPSTGLMSKTLKEPEKLWRSYELLMHPGREVYSHRWKLDILYFTN
ncbi:hypothetical protein BHE90_002124 [Fusarium euwallaceae]|uniref:Uncharacterized protein n=1 Tax=Fusarium euwallaceae TaxID=1147111 RepID=A0A430M5R6_9HYPO|nr:hypothetical protein BHE90_002124 [Fusarium euwallaceae]